jgi:hypothetical protein
MESLNTLGIAFATLLDRKLVHALAVYATVTQLHQSHSAAQDMIRRRSRSTKHKY